jgi:hypothetical protein
MYIIRVYDKGGAAASVQITLLNNEDLIRKNSKLSNS